jgi:starch phosphorylase
LFEVQVYLGKVAPDAVRVELYANAVNDLPASCLEMKRDRPIADAANAYLYTASVPATRSTSDYTARVVPHCDGVAVPLEATRILWQR